MKATELMIGDWVKLTNPKGEWIDNVKIDENLFSIFLRDGEEGFVRFEPIPLSPEILEKNGFHYFPSATPHYYLESVDVLLNKEQGGCGYYTDILNHRIFINYVHELQHALRLCGLDDLADNFQI